MKAAQTGTLWAEAREISKTFKLASYTVEVKTTRVTWSPSSRAGLPEVGENTCLKAGGRASLTSPNSSSRHRRSARAEKLSPRPSAGRNRTAPEYA